MRLVRFSHLITVRVNGEDDGRLLTQACGSLPPQCPRDGRRDALVGFYLTNGTVPSSTICPVLHGLDAFGLAAHFDQPFLGLNVKSPWSASQWTPVFPLPRFFEIVKALSHGFPKSSSTSMALNSYSGFVAMARALSARLRSMPRVEVVGLHQSHPALRSRPCG